MRSVINPDKLLYLGPLADVRKLMAQRAADAHSRTGVRSGTR